MNATYGKNQDCEKTERLKFQSGCVKRGKLDKKIETGTSFEHNSSQYNSYHTYSGSYIHPCSRTYL